MENLVNTLLPMFGTILLGALAKYLNLLKAEDSATINKFVYFIAFPSLLFVVLARSPIEDIFYWPFINAWGSSLFITFGLTTIICILWKSKLGETALNSLNTTCSNTGFIGVFIIITIYDQQSAVAAITATAFLVIIVISLVIFLLEQGTEKELTALQISQKIIISLSRNPLMIGATLGIISALLGTLPQPVEKMFDVLGFSAIPLSLFALGSFFAGQKTSDIKQNLSTINLLIFIKLIIHPVIAWILVTYIFSLDPKWAAITIILAPLPPATTCFVLAQRYDTCVSQTASMIILSTLYSIITLPIVLLFLNLANI